ncbi:MAG: energy transducer TonB [Pseudomonadota bacterium]
MIASVLILMAQAVAPVVSEPRADSSLAADVQRVPLHTTIPAYPKLARRDRIEGDVEVCFFVDRRGRPSKIAVRRSTHRMFEKPSIRAVRASRYEPLDKDAVMSGIKTCRTFIFRLESIDPDASR